MPSKLDEHFAEQAKKLARTAAMALEEARSYVFGIKDKHLREQTETEVNKIVEEL